jgi:membrane protein YdbS with pleckstrin-like domain
MFEQRDFSFIYKYFIAEKQESLLFLIVGISAVLLAVVCWFFIKSNPSFFKGAAIPLLAIGLIQVVVGYTLYSRTDKQKADIAYNIGIEPVNYAKQTEQPRMKTVMKNFVIYRCVEIIFIITGLVLIFLFRSNPDKSFWYGFGIALALQAIIMLGADYFAEKRGKVYTAELEKIISGK